MEIQGKVIAALPMESGTSKAGNAWQKRNFVIETPGQYPKKVCMQLFGDKVNDCPNVGEEVKVSFDIDSREYNGRWYTQLNAFKVERPQPAAPAYPTPPTPAPTAAYDSFPPPPGCSQTGDDDLPF